MIFASKRYIKATITALISILLIVSAAMVMHCLSDPHITLGIFKSLISPENQEIRVMPGPTNEDGEFFNGPYRECFRHSPKSRSWYQPQNPLSFARELRSALLSVFVDAEIYQTSQNISTTSLFNLAFDEKERLRISAQTNSRAIGKYKSHLAQVVKGRDPVVIFMCGYALDSGLREAAR